MPEQEHHQVDRRRFMAAAAATGLFTVLPRRILGGAGYRPPSETLNIAAVGCGGRGWSLLNNAGSWVKQGAKSEATEKSGEKVIEVDGLHVPGENIVALCDVDLKRARKAFERWKKARKYRDFRVLLDKEKEIDAVLVATPDHTHAAAAMAAIERDKHVYVEKPMTHDIAEARALTEAAARRGVVTQMGNQGHSGEGIRLMCEWLQAGAIGPVREVHCWTNRPVWPQGCKRPKEKMEVPPTLDWDLWLGPAPERPYHECYLPFDWRGWWDFGTGVMGDMGCHILDPVYAALRLGYPEEISATSTTFNRESPPIASIIRYAYPAREGMPPVKITWWDGGLMPPRPEELEPGRRMGDGDGGCLFIGEKGKLMCGCYGRSPQLIPQAAMRAFQRPPRSLPRVKRVHRDGHMDSFLQAIKEGGRASSDFAEAGPLTENILLANLALLAGEPIRFDPEKMKVTNCEKANRWVQREYRKGWSL